MQKITARRVILFLQGGDRRVAIEERVLRLEERQQKTDERQSKAEARLDNIENVQARQQISMDSQFEKLEQMFENALNRFEARDKIYTERMWKLIFGLVALMGGVVAVTLGIKTLPKMF